MTTPDAGSTPGASVNDAGTAGPKPTVPPSPSNQPPIPTKTKNQNIHVSPAVLDAARKDGEELLRDLRTSLGGLAPTLRTAFFGLIIGMIGCFQGMRTKGGTAGVGFSATSSVVLSSLFVILADVILVKFILVFFS